ncbi:MAG TPA: AraC family transcriptional regulator ligand-binding domain-containing protein [Myxococcaceae bacterium]|nr:AraC family transcriptional regulator ligand-binding domain-containing protein [Myxococcaceae bacterium]
MHGGIIPVPRSLFDRLTALGVDVDRVLREAGIPGSRAQGPNPTATFSEYLAFWRAAEALGPADLGVRFGAAAQAHQLDVASIAALHSPNLGAALRKLERYRGINCTPGLWTSMEGGVTRVGFCFEATRAQLPSVVIDSTFASLLALLRRGTGTAIVPFRLELARPPAHAAILEGHFGCPVNFIAPIDVLVLPGQVLSLPFITHNPDLLAVMLPGLESEWRERAASGSIAEDVRTLLARAMTGERPSVSSIAAQLGVTPRSLQRRLTVLGTSYQGLLAEVRHDSARRLLGKTGLRTAEVGFLLGYEEVTSFARAFHEWEGVTPEQWRRSQRASRDQLSAA